MRVQGGGIDSDSLISYVSAILYVGVVILHAVVVTEGTVEPATGWDQIPVVEPKSRQKKGKNDAFKL